MIAIIVTHESSGFDKYSQEVAKRVRAKSFHSQRYFNAKTLPEFLERLSRCDGVVHITNQNFARFAGVLRTPYIVTVHDLIRNFYDFDGETYAEQMWLKLDEHFIKRAEAIIAVSEFSKSELISRLGVDAQKVTVIYNGLDHEVFNLDGLSAKAPSPYALYVGSERPRKNLNRLVQALALVRRKHPDVVLVKVGDVGRDKSFAHSWRDAAKELRVPVIFVGKTSDIALASWYRGASVLVFPSLMEGFGLPPVEAMACGCPVVVSELPIFREIIGSAGWFVDPLNPESIAEGITGMLKRGPEYSALGLERVKMFSWDEAARKTQEVYDGLEKCTR